MIKRAPHIVKVRCLFNGADTSKLLYLKSESDALETMRRYVPKNERTAIRLIDCRLATQDEITDHVAQCRI